MQFFIGIVPPEDYKEKIILFQKRWSNNRLIDGVEPHITVKTQSGLTPDKEWIGKVEAACKNILAFKVTLAEPKVFR